MRIVKLKLLFLFMYISIIPYGLAKIVDFDDHWQQRQKEAERIAAEAYNPDPYNVTNTLNEHVYRHLKGKNYTRSRRLSEHHKYTGPCIAKNPIDECWRCDKDWAKNRKKLADCALGFGHHVIGGRDGEYYEVTDPSDDDMVHPKPGTLRHAVIQPVPLWITFKHGMVIRLSEELIMTSNKTVDGRGGHIHIVGGAGFMIQFVHNVIIHNVHIHDIKEGNGGWIRDSVDHYGIRGRSDGDGISIFGGTRVWIDHVSMSNCYDGLIDAIEASTAITISNCHFTDHNDVMLFGAHDNQEKDEIMQITLAFNHFGKRLIQRMPRCRWGFFHVVNNDYTHWQMYAIGGSQHPVIISEGNRFIAPPNIFAKEVTKRVYSPEEVWKNWLWTSDNDLMQNGAFFVPAGDKTRKTAFLKQKGVIPAQPGHFVRHLTEFSGALKCIEGQPC